jgi:hypothetical protein
MPSELEKWIRQLCEPYREIGYRKFHNEFFADAELIKDWPDPAVRQQKLRELWDQDAERWISQFIAEQREAGYERLLESYLARTGEAARQPDKGKER